VSGRDYGVFDTSFIMISGGLGAFGIERVFSDRIWFGVLLIAIAF